MSERIWEKDYGPFRVFGYVAPEEMDVEDIFDDDASKLNMFHIKHDIAYGKKLWVYATAKVYCKGVELGDASMGGLLYKDYDGIKEEIFEKDTHDIVHCINPVNVKKPNVPPTTAEPKIVKSIELFIILFTIPVLP